jgi:hypothetical protein
MQISPDGAPVTHTYPGIPGTAHQVVLVNEAPGLDRVTVTVAGTPMMLETLRDSNQRTVGLAPVMFPNGLSTLQLDAEGRPPASGVVVEGDTPLAGAPAPITKTGHGRAWASDARW